MPAVPSPNLVADHSQCDRCRKRKVKRSARFRYLTLPRVADYFRFAATENLRAQIADLQGPNVGHPLVLDRSELGFYYPPNCRSQMGIYD